MILRCMHLYCWFHLGPCVRYFMFTVLKSLDIYGLFSRFKAVMFRRFFRFRRFLCLSSNVRRCNTCKLSDRFRKVESVFDYICLEINSRILKCWNTFRFVYHFVCWRLFEFIHFQTYFDQLNLLFNCLLFFEQLSQQMSCHLSAAKLINQESKELWLLPEASQWFTGPQHAFIWITKILETALKSNSERRAVSHFNVHFFPRLIKGIGSCFPTA